MSAASDSSTQSGADLASALTTKKRTRKSSTTKSAAKKSATKKATTQKATAKKTTTKKAATRKSSSTTSSTARRRRTTTNAKRSTASLRSDLTKLAGESYTAGDFTRGATVLIQQEGVEILRDALMVMLASKTPLIGGMVSDAALNALLDKVADNYKKLTVADRKALRAVINWLRGDASSDEATKQNLVALLSGQATTEPAVPTIEPGAPLGPNDLKLKKLR
ncbi:MAG: hypothetical protein DYG89_54290 [Caldilinea sp. CFX5]|nr:hypothetical protein [Caldilinea sp. CFX5]